MSFGNPMLRYCEQHLVPHHSCLLSLLMAASLGRTPAIRYWAEEALRWVLAVAVPAVPCASFQVSHIDCRMRPSLAVRSLPSSWPHCCTQLSFRCIPLLRSWIAQRMHQGRVISLLEPYLEHELAPVRQKAAQHLMVAT